MAHWKKLGNIFCPDNHAPWMVSHAANPVAEHLGEGIVKVYFTCRDNQNRSHIGSARFDFNNNFRLVDISEKPLVVPGEPGLFDDSGTAMGCFIDWNGSRFLYYLGWNLKVTVPWLNTIGLAVDRGQGFVKYSKAPVMDRSDVDPFSISYPFILVENGIWRMWYGSNLSWGKAEAEMRHVIKYAESSDGINWKRSGKVVVGLEHEGEFALSKPMVIHENSTYHMWYSYRGKQSYRIGYAISSNGADWERRDHETGIDVSSEGWDSEMIEYPFVIDVLGKRYMLYNGNAYGKTGFGIAEMIK